MLELTRKEFIKMFNRKPGELFDLTKILTEKHKVEAMGLPDPHLMRVRAEYGTLSSNAPESVPLIYCLDVGYFIDNGRFKAQITNVIIFDDQAEQDLHKAIQANKTQNWQEN